MPLLRALLHILSMTQNPGTRPVLRRIAIVRWWKGLIRNGRVRSARKNSPM